MIQKIYLSGILALLAVGLGVVHLAEANHDETMTVEANIMVAGQQNEDMVRIVVPDRVFLGNVSVGRSSSEMTLTINNTGSVDVLVTPILLNTSDPIYTHLYFRDQKTMTVNGTSGIPVPFERIGLFTFDAAKPTSGNTNNPEDIYMILNLTTVSGSITQNLIGYTTDVRFVAVAE